MSIIGAGADTSTNDTDPGPRKSLLTVVGRLPLVTASLLGVLVALGAFPALAAAQGLDIEVSGIRNDSGVVHIAVFGDAESYEQTQNPLATVTVPAVEGTVTAHIDLPTTGKFAISSFHDENSDDKLDTNLLGMPKEGYGFSNAPGGIGKPKFEKIAVEVGEGRSEVGIELRYLL